MPFCTKCGTQLADDAAFCSRCGAPQRSLSVPNAPAPPVPVPPPPVPYMPPAQAQAPYTPPAQAPYTPPVPARDPYAQQAPAPAPYVPPTATPIVAPAPYSPPVRTPEGIVYSGEGVPFSLFGKTVTIPADLDCLNFYRKMYRDLARESSERLRSAFYTYIHTLDEFLERFYEFYLAERAPLLEEAYTTIQRLGYYDVSLESFTEQHTSDFCLIQEDLNETIERFNATIEKNQSRRAHIFNMLPGVIFDGGISGFAQAFALNMGLSALQKNAIAKANVTPAQRAQIFADINVDTLIERARLDYWRVFASLTYTMKSHGYPVAFPVQSDAQRTANIYANLANNRIPEDKIPDVIEDILTTCPYNTDFFKYLNYCGMNSPEVQRLNEYIGYDGVEA